MTDRTETLLQTIQDRIADLREDVASLSARVDGLVSAAPIVEVLRGHQGRTSNAVAELRAELRRLWWLAGVASTAAAAALGRLFTI